MSGTIDVPGCNMNTSAVLPSSHSNNPQSTTDTDISEKHSNEQYPLADNKSNGTGITAGTATELARSVRFKIRIADLDYYMAEPGPLDHDSCQFLPPRCPVLKVPVVRVYGANEAGQKTCLHIHQAYPYFYVPYEGSLEPSQLQVYIQQLGLSLNHAACITFKTPQDPWKSQYVAAITPVKGIPFYGYHVGYSCFLKVYLFNPDLESRIVDLMRSGAIMGTQFQPFESHIPFRLQFFIDFNLYGMGWLELEEALLRNEVPFPRIGDHPKRLTRASVSETRIWSPENDPGRISHCEIEMDSTVDRIVNRDRAPERRLHQSLEECFKPPSLSAQVPSMADLWEDDAKRRKASNLPTQEPPKTQVRDPVSIPWLNHDLNKQMVADLVQEMISQSQTKTPTQGDFNNFEIKEDPVTASFMTAYESVDFLCPRMISDPDESFEARSQIASQIPFVYNEADSSILVDESIISQTGEVFEEDNMNSRKEILKGLAGLQGIDEQIGDDEFPLPDINDFQDEVFIDEADEAGGTDEADIWDGIGSFDLEGHIEEADSAIVNMVDRRNIPQFDGGGDEHPLYDDNKGEDAARNWRKVTQNPGRKRTRFSSSSLPAPQEPPAQSPKRFCEVVASGSTASRSVLRPRSFRQSDRPSRIHVDMSNSNNRPATLTDLTPVDDSIEDGDYSDFDIEDVSKGSGIIPHLRERFKQPRRARDSPKPITGYDYPEPASPSRTYFLSAMDEMWSSPSPPLERPAFLYSPPRPSSPDLASAHTVYVSDLLPQSSVDKPTHQHTVTLNSPAAPRSPEVNRLSTHNCRASTIVNQTFLGDEPLAQDDVPYGAQMDDENSGVFHETHLKRRSQEDISKHVLAEDSIIHDSFDDVLSQSTIPEPIPAETSVLHGSTPHIYRFAIEPPTTQDLLHSFTEHGLPNVVYQKPYFSNEQDVPSKAKAFGGKEFRVQSNGIKTMPIFNGALGLNKSFLPGEGFRFWEPIYSPPSRATIQSWLKEEEVRARLSLRSAAGTSTQKRKERISQIEGPTQKNPFGYKNSPTKTAASVAVEKDFLDVLSLEVYCQTRGGLLPDPKYDQILAVFYCWQTDREGLISNGWAPGYRTGIFTHAKAGMMRKLAAGRVGFDIYVAENEGAMMNAVIDHVRELDPDILAGYEVHKLSWGYLVDRYQTLFGLDMSKLLSRVRPLKAPVLTMSILEARDSYNTKHHAGLKFPGRHLFNVWRLIRGEVALTNYGFGNVVFHVLQQRIPHYTHETLTKWWLDGIALHQSRVIRHYLHRVQYTLQLIESQELISRTSEFARVFGVDFFSVISRGSQYKVESMMVRLAKPENYIMISPSRAQVAAQRALEVIPMVMEPESGFYEDPVVVLDFQSLYPSVMIAYNICYSTCLGKLGGGTKIGVLTEYKIKDGALPLMEEHLHIAPNNVMYVNQGIRRGLLGRMLAEILDTRVMIKKAMKEYPGNRSLLKLLEARQLSLKFIANVTYGYTSASYSGRMPGIEIADSIVLSARETLERAIRFVNDSPKWNARVVYGDTDSMFVHLKGRTRQEAFEIGYDIAETITRMNPRPVKLKFEKVYDKCFLVTKKRYVGSSYESPNQKEPIFDAKGIETIRRDGVPAVQKIMETCIKTMFRTQDLSLVKSYFVRQLGKVLEGRVLVPDLMFGKEVRMGGYSEKGVPPPGAVVSARRMELDPRSEPQHGERVPYVVVYGDLGARLTDQVVEPKQLLVNKNLRLNGEYYIRKHIIPSMERIFQLAGADVKSWYEEMPRVQRAVPFGHSGVSNGGTGRSASTTPMVATTVVPTEVTAAMVAAQEERQQQLVQAGDDQFIENENVEVDELAAAGDAEPSEGVPNTEPEGMSVRPKFLPRRRGGKGYVSVGSRIDRYYQSQLCVICSKMIVGQKPNRDLCADCMSEQGRIKSMLVMQNRLSNAEKMFRATVDVCSSCCRSAPNGGSSVGDIENGVANSETDLVACESLECGVFWQRRRAQDSLSIAQHLTNRVMKDLEDFSYK